MTSLYRKAEKFVVDSFTKSGGSEGIKHFKRTVYWVKKLKPKADEALLISAIAHDIERAFRDSGYEKIKKTGFKGEEHLNYHQKKAAQIISDFLKKSDAPKKFIRRVKMLISKHEVGGNSDQNILKDADSISFFENQVGMFITKKVSEVGKEKVEEKFSWMYERITSSKAKKIARPYFEKAIKALNV